jgi:hypothetical protein
MNIVPATAATQNEHKTAEIKAADNATNDEKNARVILVLSNVIKLSPPPQKHESAGMAAPQRQEMKEPIIIWIDPKAFTQYQERFSLLFETLKTLPKELIEIIFTYEDDEEFFKWLKEHSLPADEVEIRPAVPTRKAQWCRCLCCLCVDCDHCISWCHEEMAVANGDAAFPICAPCQACCIGYCHSACRYGASCAEMPYEPKNVRATDPTVNKDVWTWYRCYWCQCCPESGTMPPLNIVNKYKKLEKQGKLTEKFGGVVCTCSCCCFSIPGNPNRYSSLS